MAVQDSLYTAGRRGVGATVLLEKIAGAAAEEGGSLAEVTEIASGVNANGRSMGMALTIVHRACRGTPTFDLGADEIEIGIGIHGSPAGGARSSRPVDEIAETLVEPILSDLPFAAGDRVLAFVNGMGGAPLIELYVAYNSVAKILEGAASPSREASSATTSRASRWPASRSPS